ncbi:unnamed protein product [Parnassius apollo]|uniref:(apollo) hypothetical protein n=1 Tax=Parnassius apollo TaxID=110799 RepID=A0A8S3Y685_PARAO|nr:unnamed protein product [Parnassius apollo]
MQKEENTTRKRKSMTRTTCVKREKRSKINKIKTKSRKTTSVNKKKFKKKFNESSSEISDFQLSIAESDDSEYKTLNDYIKICLQDQSEKENLEPEIPFGISDIEYFTGNVDNLNEGDWLIAKFATKKSFKHFVGRILFIRNNIPTIEFLRKVKNTANSKRLTFTYPPVKDIYEMHHVDDVVLVLPQSTITRRGQVMFEVDFSSYNIQ